MATIKKIKLFVSFFLLGIILFSGYLYLERQRVVLENRKKAWFSLVESVKQQIGDFDGQASVVIKDLKMDWEVSYDKDKLFAAASLAKVPIMGACFKAAEEGRIRLGDAVELKGAYKVNGSGFLKEVPNGTYFSVENLIELMIAESDNTAANILINMLGFDYINECFKETGLSNTNLYRKMMDFNLRRRGVENYTTAQDMALILEKIYRGTFLNKTISRQCREILLRQKINDRIPAKLPSDTTVAHKTGLENNVCHDVGVVFTKKGDYLVCVLTGHAKSNKIAKRFIAALSLEAFNYYQRF